MRQLKDFLKGAGSILNLVPHKRTINIDLGYSSSEQALRSDWEKIGKDIENAIRKKIPSERP